MNYRLYEHIKQSPDGNKSHKAGRSHAKGTSDRQDAYLYGHPLGPKKRFRSPHDFFPHLLWLLSDDSGDPDNCACKFCSPEGHPEGKMSELKEKLATQAVVQIKEDTSSKPPAAKTSPTKALAPAQAISPPTKNIQPSQVRQSVIQPKPTPLPNFLTNAQKIDASFGFPLFRSGEVVWFNRGEAWGLGLIFSRQVDPQQRRYYIQPLSHPIEHPRIVEITQETSLRPWLAWTAPQLTHQTLRDGLEYDDIDWNGLYRGIYGEGNPEVDASILASKRVDKTYTPIFQMTVPDQLPTTRTYAGLYLGAEKIWIGEPVRLRMDDPLATYVMVVNQIFDTFQPNDQVPDQGSWKLSLAGDMYLLQALPPSTSPPDDSHLPNRMREDSRFCNRAAAAVGNTMFYWRLVNSLIAIGLDRCKGRWYENSVFAPIIQGDAEFSSDLQKGAIRNLGPQMNGRSDKELDMIGTRTFTRKEALGYSIPTDCVIMDDT
jgi:hypothetical protein